MEDIRPPPERNAVKKHFVLIFTLILILTVRSAQAGDEACKPKEAALRTKVVEYMRAAATVEWTPQEDIPYYDPDSRFVFKKGETYYGLPYTQGMRNTSLAIFETQIETRDGVRCYVGPTDRLTYLGSDCSASISNAWRQADPDFPALLTRRMIPDRPKETVPVGDYVLNFYDSTPDILKENGFDVMKKAYACLKPADAVLLHVNYDGHVMLVLKNDPDNERLFIADQTGLANDQPKSRDGHSTWRLDQEYSYQQLFDAGYIPIALRVIDDATHEMELFNGQNLDGWTVNILNRDEDVKNVFSVHDGMIHVSGEEYGGIMTTGDYSNYRLTVEFKWGEKTWGNHENTARDSGVLIHSFGSMKDFGGVWARSVEANLLEGGIGDFWIVGGPDDNVAGTCDVVEVNGIRIFDPINGKPVRITKNSDGCFGWRGRSPNYKNIKGFRGPCDADRPNAWNEMVVYAVGNVMEVYVNGKFVNRVYDLNQTHGKIQLQSEGAEIFFRRVTLRPWTKPLN